MISKLPLLFPARMSERVQFVPERVQFGQSRQNNFFFAMLKIKNAIALITLTIAR